MRLLLSLLLICVSCATETQRANIKPSDLTCEYISNPAVVDVENPRLAWVNHTLVSERGLKQTAYQIRVASSQENLRRPDLWDSRKVVSDQSNRIVYAGKPLPSREECWWQVRVWDGAGHVSDWSEPGTWRMGLLKEVDWEAVWIGAPWQGEAALPKPDGGPNGRPEAFGPPAPMLRKEFQLSKQIEKATAFVTGLGYFELYANGQKVGDDVLVPNQTNYGKRPNLPKSLINVEDNFRRYKVMYLAYDLTSLLEMGKNVIGSVLGNGFYNPAKFWAEGYGSPRFLCQVHVTYTDGSEDVIISDESWKATKGPILMDMVYYGEIYDARQEQPGWNMTDFDDTGWEPVVKRKAPEGELVAHTPHPDKVMERIPPVSIERLGDGHYQVDFGVEVSGWVRLNRVEGPAGHQIDLTFNGNLYSGDNTYICKGEGSESYAPRFNWFVFSGIEIKNWPGELRPEDLMAEAVYTYVEESATFETSNQLFNTINKIWRRSQVDNMHGGVASDCPHRERSAYTGDGQVVCKTVMHNYDARSFYHKWIQDVYEAQNIETGYVPNGAPWQPGCGGGVAWGAAICIMPWEFYVQYGATDILEDTYTGMKEYIRYMQTWVDNDGIMFSQRTGANGEILKWFNLGEWVSPGEPLPDDLVHTFYFWRCAAITAKVAAVLGQTKESETYQDLAGNTRKAFHQRFFDKTNKSYGNGGGNILALKMGVPEEVKEAVLEALQKNIQANKGHLDTGIFGTRFFFEVLAENGMNQLAFDAMNKTEEPSFGRWIELGSTTAREKWDEGGSYNHPMFGGGLVWLYRNLAGMQVDPSRPAYKHIIFKPQPVPELDFVTYQNHTIFGEAGITWRRNQDVFEMDITVPVGSTADVYLPVEDINQVSESDQSIEDNPWVTFVKQEGAYAICQVESGKYQFTVKN